LRWPKDARTRLQAIGLQVKKWSQLSGLCYSPVTNCLIEVDLLVYEAAEVRRRVKWLEITNSLTGADKFDGNTHLVLHC